MLRLLFGFLILIITWNAQAQQHSIALGIYTGMTIPYTYDAGIADDSRYKARYNAKLAPIGIAFSMDYKGYGIIATPGLITIAQNYYVVNTVGGHNGRRDINLQYLNIPVGIKLHIIDLSFFRVSGIASVSAAYLLDGSDEITHSQTKLKFPQEVVLPANYIQEYDGVLVPAIKNQTIIEKEDYNALQFFAGIGMRTDWDITNNWRVSLDVRANYGFTDPRTDEYMKRVEAYETLYDTPGKRNEMFAQLSIGIARYFDFDKKDQDRKKSLKSDKRKFVPKKLSKPKGSKPRY